MGAARDKLTLSEQNALEVFRMAKGYIACRRALEQTTRGSRNVGMALQASNALRGDRPVPGAQRRLGGIDTVRLKQPAPQFVC